MSRAPGPGAGAPAASRSGTVAPRVKAPRNAGAAAGRRASTLGRSGTSGLPSGGGVLDAVRAADLPPGTPYAWVAGESGVVRSVRRHLVHERGIDRRRVMFTGYWRRGATEDDLIAEAA
ncbi:siderophore-interacting protein [Dactylosporangium sp. NPDC050588]|uniref:siderophore-interacting protein n=1 Tax=Dactylosporangium sp. NPDC050588 TaxID=3157211 RepID=UPI0034089668